MNRRLAAAFILVAASTISAAALHAKDPAPRTSAIAAPKAPPAACAIAAGDEASFVIARASMTEVRAGGARDLGKPQTVAARLEARVDLRALSSRDDGAIVAVRVSALEQTTSDGAAPAVDVSAPMLVKIAPTCSVVGYAHPARVGAEDARVAEALVSTLDWTVDPSSRTYGATFRDARGEMEAEHQTRADGAVTRTIRRVAKLFRAGRAPATIVASAGRAERGDGPFLTRVAEQDDLQQRADAGVEIRMHQELRAERVTKAAVDPFAAVDLDPAGFVWGDHFADAAPSAAAPPAGAKAITIEDALAEIARRRKDEDGMMHVARTLAGALPSSPGLAAKLADAIVRGRIGDKDRPGVMLALASAGTIEARGALVSLADNRAAGVASRVEAVMVLGSATGAGKPEADALARLSRADEREVASTSTLSMGVLAHARAGDDPEVSSAIRADLDDRMRREIDPGKLGLLAAAAANTGDTSFLPAIEKLADSDDPMLRAAALAAAERMPGGPDLVRARLADEADPGVRRALFAHLSHEGGAPDAAAVDLALARIAGETDGGTLPSLVRILGRAGTPAARAALIALYQRTADADLKQLIGSFVSAAELEASR